MEFLPEEISKYTENHTSQCSDLLQKIERDTFAEVLIPRMLAGHLQGRALAMLSHMIQPKCILEVGTYTGYSALCFAEGLPKDGKIITLDINEELESRVRSYFQASEFNNKIDYRIGNALDIIPKINESLDFVYLDADKENYINYYQLVFDKVPVGGYIVADNVLWSGKVVEEKQDKDTAAIVAYNKMVQEDSRVENVLFPIRDGILIARKIKA